MTEGSTEVALIQLLIYEVALQTNLIGLKIISDEDETAVASCWEKNCLGERQRKQEEEGKQEDYWKQLHFWKRCTLVYSYAAGLEVFQVPAVLNFN